jgi:hypothetical protein
MGRLFIAVVADYEDAGICGGEKGGAIQVVTYDTQDFRRECQFHNLSRVICVGTTRLWVGRGVLSEFYTYIIGGGTW